MTSLEQDPPIKTKYQIKMTEMVESGLWENFSLPTKIFYNMDIKSNIMSIRALILLMMIGIIVWITFVLSKI